VVAELGLLIEKVRLVVLPVKMGFAVRDLAMTGGAITVSDEMPYPVEVVFGPVSVEVMVPLIFVYCPATLPNTFTEIVQLAFAERVAPLRLIMEVPAVAVVVPPVSVPTVQAVVKPLGVAINKPVGRVSEKPTPVNAVAVFGLVNVNLRVLELPWEIGEVRKLFESVGTTGSEQPVMTISSINTADVVLLAPIALILKAVVPAPVVVALFVPDANQLPFDAVMVERVE